MTDEYDGLFNSCLKVNSFKCFPCILHKTSRLFGILATEYAQVFEVKERYLVMSLEEKRQQYRGGKYTELSSVPTWVEYFVKNRSRLISQMHTDFSISVPVEKEEVDSALNDKVSLWQGDITTLEIDAIVNAANTSLLGGGGVDGAIHRAAGPSLVEECRLLKGCATGDAKITGGYKLPAKHVIHTVGPRGEKPDMLESCYRKCLEIAVNQNIRTIAFPCISTGIYGYPADAAALVALGSVKSFLEKESSNIDRVIFCLFLPTDVRIYENLIDRKSVV